VGPEAAASVGPNAVAAEEAEAPLWRSGGGGQGYGGAGAPFLYLNFYMHHEHIVLPFFARNRLEHFAMN
jgi:hypothetical protein